MPTINALEYYNEQNRKPDVPTVKKVQFISSKVSRFYCEGSQCQWVLDELLKVAIVKCVKVKSPLYSVTEISLEHSHIKNE